MTMTGQAYQTDVNDTAWAIIEPLLPAPPSREKGGHPRIYPLRDIWNGIAYFVRGGIPWRMKVAV